MIEVTEDFYFDFVFRRRFRRHYHMGTNKKYSDVKYTLDRKGNELSKITHDDRFYLSDRFEPEIPDEARVEATTAVYVQATSQTLLLGVSEYLGLAIPTLPAPRWVSPPYLGHGPAGFFWLNENFSPLEKDVRDPDEFVRIVKERLECKK